MNPITFGAGLLSSGIGFAGNWALQQEQNKKNEELWNKQTEYNKPINQITRLREAGLNPALAYGKGVSTNIAGPPPTMSRAEAPNVSSDIAATQQVDNATQQNKILREQARTAKAEANIKEHDALLFTKSPIPSTAPLPQGIAAAVGAGIDKAKNWWESIFPKSGSYSGSYDPYKDRGNVNSNQGIR